jgi:hypothetical protein
MYGLLALATVAVTDLALNKLANRHHRSADQQILERRAH